MIGLGDWKHEDEDYYSYNYTLPKNEKPKEKPKPLRIEEQTYSDVEIDWIPCQERMPKLDKNKYDIGKEYLVTYEYNDSDERFVGTASISCLGKLYMDIRSTKIIAWAEPPKPYEGK